LILIGAMALGALAPGSAAAKKAKPLNITETVGAQVPNATPAARGELKSTIKAGKKFKGLKIRDVNVTVQTTGSAPNAAQDLQVRLIAPNGAGVVLFSGLPGQNIGPLTIDDEARLVVGGITNNIFLGPPFVGSVAPGISLFGKPLSLMDNGPVRGNWVLSIVDNSSPTTSVLEGWTLNVKTGKPFRTEE
jgi:subtilisin-like proprotein convertase family protein